MNYSVETDRGEFVADSLSYPAACILAQKKANKTGKKFFVGPQDGSNAGEWIDPEMID